MQMESDEQIFRHSLGKLGLMALGVLFLGYAAFVIGRIDYFLVTLVGIAFIVLLLYATSSVRISSEAITTSRLFGSKNATVARDCKSIHAGPGTQAAPS